jgi:hypothetical protein
MRIPRRVKKWGVVMHPRPRYERLIWRWWLRYPLETYVKVQP